MCIISATCYWYLLGMYNFIVQTVILKLFLVHNNYVIASIVKCS